MLHINHPDNRHERDAIADDNLDALGALVAQGCSFGAGNTYDYTRVEHDGRVVALLDDAQPTSRLLPDNLRANNYAEWSCKGVDSDGIAVMVYWLHRDDGETEPDQYDWSDVDRIEDID